MVVNAIAHERMTPINSIINLSNLLKNKNEENVKNFWENNSHQRNKSLFSERTIQTDSYSIDWIK